MLNFTPKLKLDKVKDAPAGGAAAPVPPVVEPPPAAPAASEGNFDELGYEKAPAAPAAEIPKPPEEKPPEDEKVKDPATGYGEAPPKIEEPPPAEKPPEEKPVPDELDSSVEGLPKEEAQKIKDFAKKHNVSKEVAKAFADVRKAELAADEAAVKQAQKDFENSRNKTRSDWHNELKNDPAFGGEKFNKNIMAAEKVLAEFMPQTKKMLTERKAMLPPYVMRDLAKMAEHLYSSERLVQGDPKAPEKVVNETDEALSFYQ